MKIPEWMEDMLHEMREGYVEYVKVDSQEDADLMIERIQRSSRQLAKQLGLRFICTVLLAMNMDNASEQKILVEIVALAVPNKKFTI